MKIAFLSNPTVGHTNFLISLAAKSVAMNNNVIFYLPGSYNSFVKGVINNPALHIDSKLQKNDIPYKLIPISLYQGLLGIILSTKRGLDEVKFALRVFTAGGKKYTQYLFNEFSNNPPDIIIYDYTFFSAIAVSEKLNIPRVAIYHSGLPFPEYPIPPIGTKLKYNKYPENIFNKYLDFLLKKENEIKKKFELIIEKNINVSFLSSPSSKFLNIVNTIFEAEYSRNNLNYCIFFSGPDVKRLSQKNEEEYFNKQKGRLIYISLGTVFNNQSDLFIKIINSIDIKNVEVLVAAGSSYNKLKLKISKPNIRIEKFVPQLNVLKHTDVFITHGGKNSINEALKFGVPMLFFPAGGEQEYNANLIEYLKVGINFSKKIKSFGKEEMTSVLNKLFNDNEIKLAIKNLSKKHKNDGADLAYEKIVNKYQSLKNEE